MIDARRQASSLRNRSARPSSLSRTYASPIQIPLVHVQQGAADRRRGGTFHVMRHRRWDGGGSVASTSTVSTAAPIRITASETRIAVLRIRRTLRQLMTQMLTAKSTYRWRTYEKKAVIGPAGSSPCRGDNMINLVAFGPIRSRICARCPHRSQRIRGPNDGTATSSANRLTSTTAW